MILGITGTRQGMSDAQLEAVARFLSSVEVAELHHGDCVGVDAQIHTMLAGSGCRIVIHPGTNDEHRAFCKGHEERPRLTHFARNRNIVDACDVILGVSVSPHRLYHGGTWYTLDYAYKIGRRMIIVWPDGHTSGGYT